MLRPDNALDANTIGVYDELDQLGDSLGFSHGVTVARKSAHSSSILLSKVDHAPRTQDTVALASVAIPMAQQVDDLPSGFIDQQPHILKSGNPQVDFAVDDLKATLTAIDTLLDHHQLGPIDLSFQINLRDQLTAQNIDDNVLIRTGGSSRDVPLFQSRESLLRGAIPRTVPEQDNTSFIPASNIQFVDDEQHMSGHNKQYSMVSALALSASLVILNVSLFCSLLKYWIFY